MASCLMPQQWTALDRFHLKMHKCRGFAKLYKGADILISKHFFSGPGAPTFTQLDANGNTINSVTRASVGSQNVQPAPDNGGVGSIPEVLLNTTQASGLQWPWL